MLVKRSCAINVLQHKDKLENIHELRLEQLLGCAAKNLDNYTRQIYKSESCAVKALQQHDKILSHDLECNVW